MESPLKTVYDFIKSQNYPWIDEVDMSNIPQETEVDGTKTICLVQEIATELTGFKNNKFSRLNPNIEVQLFFAVNFSGSSLDDALDLVCDLQDQGWHVSAPYPDSIDPDTSQFTKTYTITKFINYERKNE